jgi:hypothetical protein
MTMRSILGTLVIASLPVMPVWAENMTPEAIQKMVDEAVNKRLQERERREAGMEKAPPGGVQYPTPTGPITDIKVERKGEENVPLSFSSTGSGKLIYAKPFLSAPKATVGGYSDIAFTSLSSPTLDNRSRQSFNQQRLVPFIYADVTDRVKFAAELEFERGAPNSSVSTGNTNAGGPDGSISVEFAQLDYLVTEAINIRAGILLVPLGKFNLLHDSPLNDLVDRPMVSRLIIPSTWREAGAGIYGSLYPTSLSKVDYEVYAINGFSNFAGNPSLAINDTSGMRNATGSLSRDRDSSKSVVGRLAVSPMLGIEVAGSAYHGLYQTPGNYGGVAPTVSNGYVDIFALDWTLQKGPFELIGESAWARISNNNQGAIVGPAGMQGYYIQGNYHFMPEFLKRLAPGHFGESSTFTAVVRWERVDTDTDNRTKPGAAAGNRGELERLTLGLNFRPIEDTVFKFDWQFNTQKNSGLSSATTSFAGGGAPNPARIDGNGFLFMAATYF